MNATVKPTADDFELKGIARFSFRLRLLKKLAASDDPIISATATSLIRDRIARNFGLAFEFIFLGLIPLAYFITVIGYVIYLGFQPNNESYRHVIIELTKQMYWVNSGSYVAMIIGYICGVMVLLWPGMALMRKESGGDWFRLVPIENGKAFKVLLRVQMISFAIYPALTTAIIVVCNYYPSFAVFGFISYMTGSYKIIITFLQNILSPLFFIIFVSIASIFSGIKYTNVWGALVQFVAFLLVYYIIGELIRYFVEELILSLKLSEHWQVLSIVPPVLNFLICTPVAVFLAKTAILRRIMPRK